MIVILFVTPNNYHNHKFRVHLNEKLAALSSQGDDAFTDDTGSEDEDDWTSVGEESVELLTDIAMTEIMAAEFVEILLVICLFGYFIYTSYHEENEY